MAVEGWTCPPEFYNDGFICDCACGAADPDCSELENPPLANCPDLSTCNEEGVCVGGLEDIPVPDAWECPDSYWNVNDGCDCSCSAPDSGVIDPDCERPGTLWCFDGGNMCDEFGQCVDSQAPTATTITAFPTPQPTADLSNWLCPEDYYADGYSCDCSCGLHDPDCDLEDVPIFPCSGLQFCNEDNVCEDLPSIPVPDSWECNPSYFNANDGCDCECGTPDPDCELPGQQVYGCPQGVVNYHCTAEGFCEAEGTAVTFFPTTSEPEPTSGPAPTTSGPSPTSGPAPTTSPPTPTTTTQPQTSPTSSPGNGGAEGEGSSLFFIIAVVLLIVSLLILIFAVVKVCTGGSATKNVAHEKDEKSPTSTANPMAEASEVKASAI